MTKRRTHGDLLRMIVTRSIVASAVASIVACVPLTYEQARKSGEGYKRRHEHRQSHGGACECRCDKCH